MEKQTPLIDLHKQAGAHLVSFAGWKMPISYTSITEEHMAVRKAAGLFDVSHMGELWVEGENAEELLSHVFTMNPKTAKPGDCIYTHILDEQGMIIDDMIAVKFSSKRYLCVPNASMTQTIHEWFLAHVRDRSVQIEDATDKLVCIALQGPNASTILAALTDYPLENLKFFKATMLSKENEELENAKSLEEQERIPPGSFLLSRTSYTGEDGFEAIANADDGVWLWKKLMHAGKEHGLVPVGLGARDTLRLEKGFLLSGTDFNRNRTTLETGWDFAMAWDHDFIGKAALEKQKQKEHEKLRGLVLSQKAVPRHGMDIMIGETMVGKVTSGGFSPILGKGIAMAYLPPSVKKGDMVDVLVRNRRISAEVVKPPFVK